MITTMRAVIAVSLRVGQTILALSARTCRMNSPGLTLATWLPLVSRLRAGGAVRHNHFPDMEPLPSPPRTGAALHAAGLRRYVAAAGRGGKGMAGVEGLEPTALGFGDRCSTS